MAIKALTVPPHDHESLPTDADPVILPPAPHGTSHNTTGSDPITALAGEVITTGTIDGNRLPAISTTKKGAVPATGTPAGKYLRDPGDFQNLITMDVDPPVAPFSQELWLDTPDPAATDFALQLREQGHTGIYGPTIVFSKPTAGSIKCFSETLSVGRGYVFVTLPKTAVHGNKIKLTWESNSSYSDLYFVAKIVDGIYSRTSGTDFPVVAVDTYTNNTFPVKGAGNLQTIEIIHGTNASHTATITANMASSTQAYVTIMIYLVDSWAAQNAYFIVSNLIITDSGDVTLYTANLAGALNMESEGGTADYGMLGTGTIDYVDRPLSTLRYWDLALSEWVSMAEPYHNGGLSTDYFRGDKTFQTLNGAAVINTPAGSIAAVTVQAAIDELDTEKQSIAGLAAAVNLLASSLLSTTNVSLAGTGQTTIYTVPAGKRLIIDSIQPVMGADAGASVITAGQVGALTDFLPATTLTNLNAQYTTATLRPIPNTTPLKQVSYAAGTVIQVDVTTALGGATNAFRLFGFLY